MKKVLSLALIGVFYFTGVLFADKTGVGAERNQDRTGSPVATSSTQQCDKCHSGGNFNSTIDIRLKDINGNIVTEYNGGETYTYEVQIGGTGSRFGFQSVALLTSNSNAGTLSANSSNGKITTLNSRKYAEHNNPSTTGLFVMNWIAPAAGSGTVKFYAAGNNVNNNNASSGDDPVLSSPLIINESATSGISDEEWNDMVLLYPNPSENVIHISLEEAKEFSVKIFDINGKEIYHMDIFDSHFSVDVSSWKKGVYFVLFSGEINGTKNFIRS